MALNLKLYLYNAKNLKMKFIKQTSFLIVMLILTVSFSQCSTAQKLQKTAPTEFGDVYCQTWVAGIKGGGSGINIFIPVMDKSIQLDSVYFRGKATKLEVNSGETPIYIGRFKTEFNQQEDIIMSSDSNEEYANQLREKAVEIPFELKDDECVISYIKDEKTLYYKIINVQQKQPLNYPSASPKNNLINN